MTKTNYIDLVIKDAEEGPESFFIEIENDQGQSIRIGEQFQRNDGYRVIRIKKEDFDALTR